MNLPSGLVFFLDFQYGTDKTPFEAGSSLYGDGSAETNPFGNGNTGGLYGAGRFGYSTQNTQSVAGSTDIATDVNFTTASWSDLNMIQIILLHLKDTTTLLFLLVLWITWMHKA